MTSWGPLVLSWRHVTATGRPAAIVIVSLISRQWHSCRACGSLILYLDVAIGLGLPLQVMLLAVTSVKGYSTQSYVIFLSLEYLESDCTLLDEEILIAWPIAMFIMINISFRYLKGLIDQRFPFNWVKIAWAEAAWMLANKASATLTCISV